MDLTGNEDLADKTIEDEILKLDKELPELRRIDLRILEKVPVKWAMPLLIVASLT